MTLSIRVFWLVKVRDYAFIALLDHWGIVEGESLALRGKVEAAFSRIESTLRDRI